MRGINKTSAPNPAHALDGGIPSLSEVGCDGPAASDEHRWMHIGYTDFQGNGVYLLT